MFANLYHCEAAENAQNANSKADHSFQIVTLCGKMLMLIIAVVISNASGIIICLILNAFKDTMGYQFMIIYNENTLPITLYN